MSINVTIIPPSEGRPAILRVAAYCRVSTDSDDQATSYAFQSVQTLLQKKWGKHVHRERPVSALRETLRCPCGGRLKWWFSSVHRSDTLYLRCAQCGGEAVIPFRETIILDLDSADAESLLEQHPSGVFFIGEQFVDGFPIPFGPAGGGGNALPFQTRSNFPKAVTSKIPFKYPVHHLGFVRIYFQFSIRIDRVSVALTLCHFGAAVLKAFPKAGLDCFAFLNHIH